jgi:hypothetical protein
MNSRGRIDVARYLRKFLATSRKRLAVHPLIDHLDILCAYFIYPLVYLWTLLNMPDVFDGLGLIASFIKLFAVWAYSKNFEYMGTYFVAILGRYRVL